MPVDDLVCDHHACFTTETEQALLVDPGCDDPLEHIAWRPLDPGAPPELQTWRAMPKSERGRVTIQVLGLNRDVVDHVNDHIRERVHRRVAPVRDAETPERAQQPWDKAIRELFSPRQPYHAATHDALDVLVPPEIRSRLGLVLPRPGAIAPQQHALREVEPDVAALSGLSTETVLQLHARKKSTKDSDPPPIPGAFVHRCGPCVGARLREVDDREALP